MKYVPNVKKFILSFIDMLPNHLFILTINIILYIKNISKINYLHNNIYWSKSNNSKYKLKIKKIGKTFEIWKYIHWRQEILKVLHNASCMKR